MKWRAENDIENTLAAFLPDGKDDIVRKHIPSGFVGFDKSVRVGCHTSHVDCFPCNGKLTAKAIWGGASAAGTDIDRQCVACALSVPWHWWWQVGLVTMD